MAREKKRSQAMFDSSDKEKIDENTTPHGPAARGKTHQVGNSKGTCTQRNVSPPATSQPATGHSPNGQEDISEWPVTGHQSPVTGHRSNGHYTRIFNSVNHWSPAIQPPVNGLRKYQHRESQYSSATGHPITHH